MVESVNAPVEVVRELAAIDNEMLPVPAALRSVISRTLPVEVVLRFASSRTEAESVRVDAAPIVGEAFIIFRSEERRVGKECRL